MAMDRLASGGAVSSQQLPALQAGAALQEKYEVSDISGANAG